MASEIGTIRTGIQTLLNGMTPTLPTYATIPAAPVAPCAIVTPDDPFAEYLGAMHNGLVTYRFSVLLLLGQADLVDAQTALDTILSSRGPGSLNVALIADPTLSGSCAGSTVERVTAYGAHDFGSVSYVGAVVHLKIIAN